jgi:hypothetical protein
VVTRRGRAAAPGHSWTAAALGLALLLGCAGGGAPRERTVLAGNAARNLVILPLNIAAVMPTELEASSPVVWKELEVYLRAQGKELKTLSFRNARQLWLSSIGAARAADARAGFDDAARVLVGKLAQLVDFDAVIVPSLYLREAPIAGRSASWDAVERPLAIEGMERLRADLRLEGLAPGASLLVALFDALGEKLHDGIGGLDLLVVARVVRTRASAPDAITLQFTTRTELFASRENVQEGIATALAPFLPTLRLKDDADAR